MTTTPQATSTPSNGHGPAARKQTMQAARLYFDPRPFTV
jgi:hypothetical protein